MVKSIPWPIDYDQVPDDVTDEYVEEYNSNSDFDLYNISYEEYAEQRSIEDYGY